MMPFGICYTSGLALPAFTRASTTMPTCRARFYFNEVTGMIVLLDRVDAGCVLSGIQIGKWARFLYTCGQRSQNDEAGLHCSSS